MPTVVFEAGNLNAQGICRAVVCDWIAKGKAGVNITTRYDLDSGWANKAKWMQGWHSSAGWGVDSNTGVEMVYGLAAVTVADNTNPPISVQWIATELTKGTGYFAFGVRGKTLNVSTGKYDMSGHAMATRKGLGTFQFFDPNLGLLEFASSLEFYNYLPTYLSTTYPDLLSREAQVKKF